MPKTSLEGEGTVVPQFGSAMHSIGLSCSSLTLPVSALGCAGKDKYRQFRLFQSGEGWGESYLA